MEKYLTLEETAAVLRQTVAGFRFMRHEGRGPKGFKVGKRVLFAESAVEEYIRECMADAS